MCGASGKAGVRQAELSGRWSQGQLWALLALRAAVWLRAAGCQPRTPSGECFIVACPGCCLPCMRSLQTEEELQRFLDAAEECGTANELGHVEEQQEAQTPPAAGVDPRQRHAAEGKLSW